MNKEKNRCTNKGVKVRRPERVRGFVAMLGLHRWIGNMENNEEAEKDGGQRQLKVDKNNVQRPGHCRGKRKL